MSARAFGTALAATAVLATGLVAGTSNDPAQAAPTMVCGAYAAKPVATGVGTIYVTGAGSGNCTQGTDGFGNAKLAERVRAVYMDVYLQQDRPGDGLGWVNVAFAGDSDGPGNYSSATTNDAARYPTVGPSSTIKYRTAVKIYAESTGGRVVEFWRHSSTLNFNRI